MSSSSLGHEALRERRFMARMAEQAGRHKDMVDIATEIVLSSEGEVPYSDRQLFAAAYRHLIVPRRASWRILASSSASVSFETKKEGGGEDGKRKKFVLIVCCC